MSSNFRGGAFQVTTGGGAPVTTTLELVNDWTPDPRIEQALTRGGKENPSFIGALSNAPMATIATPDLETLFGANVLNAAQFGLVDTADMFYALMEHGAATGSGSVHSQMTLRRALLALQSIRARQGEVAVGQFGIWATKDGANAAMSIAHSVALPATTAAGQQFTVGPVKSGTLFTSAIETQELDYQVNPDARAFLHSGIDEPEDAAIRAIGPALTLQTRDVGNLTDALFKGAADTAVSVWFRALQNKSTPHADGSAEHLKLTFAEAFVKATAAPASQDGEATASIMIEPIDNGTDPIVTVETDQLIA